MQLERQHFSAWLQWLCRGGGHEAAKAQYDRVARMVDRALAESEVRVCCCEMCGSRACTAAQQLISCRLRPIDLLSLASEL